MSLEARAQARHADQLDGVEPGQLAGSISHPHLLGLIFERLPGVEPWLTAGRLSKAWRQWASPLRDAARHAHAGRAYTAEPWDDAGAPLLPPWFVQEQWPRLSAAQCGRAAVLAARRGELDLLTRVADLEGGHLHVLRWIKREHQEHPWHQDIWAAASLGGHIEVLRWLRQQEPPNSWGFGRRSCSDAAGAGHLDALRWLRAQRPPCPWDARTCASAAENGHLEVLKWLRQQQPPCPWGARTCSKAAQRGQVEVLQWLLQQQPPCHWNAHTCSAAAYGGQLAALQWLRQQVPPCPWDTGTCKAAALGGHLEVLQWLRQQVQPCPWELRRVRREAAYYPEMAQWAEEQAQLEAAPAAFPA